MPVDKRRNKRELTDAQLKKIGDVVRRVVGINLHSGKRELVKSRLNARLDQLNLNSYSEYIDYLNEHPGPEEFTVMLDMLSTNVTSFFREAEHFTFLAEKIIAERMASKTFSDRKIRIWSAGCSSGEEPYSIAITIVNKIKQVIGWDIRILATDISTRVLEKAKESSYKAETLKDMPPSIRLAYFDKALERTEKAFWKVKPEIRQMVTFARLNLLAHWPMKGPFEAIFCRNVMIYFQPEIQKKLVGRFYELLSPGGVLFIGHSESLLQNGAQFEFVQPTVYRKKADM